MIVSVVLELLTPTMGGFTLVALGFSAGSIYLGFCHTQSFGFLMVLANLTLFPIALWIGLKFFKHSPMHHKHELQSGTQDSPDAPPLTHLIGQVGRALTPLRPSGSALIGDMRINVVSQGKFVEAGTLLKVIHVEGPRVVVEATEAPAAPPAN